MGYNTRALGCGCTGIGSVSTPAGTTRAGEINGIATFAMDLKRVADQLAVSTRGLTLNKTLYDVTLAKMRSGKLADAPPTVAEFRNFFLGAMGQMTDSLVRAKMLAGLPVRNAAERTANQAAQAALIGPAQLMRDSLATFMHEAVRNASPGTSGLGIFGIDDIIILAVVAGVIIIIALSAVAIAAATYMADSSDRMAYAATQARAICSRSTPPCTPEQYAQVMHDLGLGPLDNAAAAAAAAAGKALSPAFMWGGIAVVAAVAGLWIYKRNESSIRSYVGSKVGA